MRDSRRLQLVEATATTENTISVYPFPAMREENSCTACNGKLRLSRPGRYDQDAVYTCNRCGRVHLVDTELDYDSIPEPSDGGWIN